MRDGMKYKAQGWKSRIYSYCQTVKAYGSEIIKRRDTWAYLLTV